MTIFFERTSNWKIADFRVYVNDWFLTIRLMQSLVREKLALVRLLTATIHDRIRSAWRQFYLCLRSMLRVCLFSSIPSRKGPEDIEDEGRY